MCKKHYACQYYASNSEQSKAMMRKYGSTSTNKERAYWRSIKNNYNLSREQYEQLVSSQSGVCAICTQPPGHRRLHIDHCHKTGKIRGLLCSKCNTAIGLLGDSDVIMERAIGYLSLFKTT